MDPVMQALTSVRQNPELLSNLKAASDPDVKKQLLADAGIELSLTPEDKQRLEVIAAGGSAPVSEEYLDSVTGGGQQVPAIIVSSNYTPPSDINVTQDVEVGTTAGGKGVYEMDGTISTSDSNSSDDDDDDDDGDDGGDADDASDASDASDAADASDGADAADAAAAFLL